jgi:acyl dehydratase
MGLDLHFKGREFPSFTFEVERGKIRELCMAIGDDNPIFFDREAAKHAGYSDTPAPLTFATVMNFWGYPEIWERMKEMGIDVKRLLHAKEEYEYMSPVYPGDVITGTVSVDSMRDGAMGMVTFKSVYTREGEDVLIAKMTIIIPPAKGEGDA